MQSKTTTNYQQSALFFNVDRKNSFAFIFETFLYIKQNDIVRLISLCIMFRLYFCYSYLLKFDITTAVTSIKTNLLKYEKIDNYNAIADATIATHVVTSITYGSDIYCVLQINIENRGI